MRDRLEGWKQISAYLKRSVWWCQNRRNRSGLPVYYISKRSRGTPILDLEDLAAWWAEQKHS